jgi:hypothetical protein
MKYEDRFKGVSLRKGLYAAIQQFVDENPEYRGVPEFVSESARLRMQDLKRLKMELAQLQLSRRPERSDKPSGK